MVAKMIVEKFKKHEREVGMRIGREKAARKATKKDCKKADRRATKQAGWKSGSSGRRGTSASRPRSAPASPLPNSLLDILPTTAARNPYSPMNRGSLLNESQRLLSTSGASRRLHSENPG